MSRSRCLIACGCILALALPGCRRKEAGEPPVASPSLTLDRNRVAIGSPLKLTYRFDVAGNASFDADYWVFVHVLEPEGDLLWTDDHQPPVPTSTWKPGQKVEYTRTVFVPNYPFIGPATIRLGLYNASTKRRLTLAGEEVSRREYLVSRLELLPQSENIFLIYKDGWHAAEVSAEDPTVEWQWTKKAATISFRNPRTDSTFYLEYAARVDKFNPPQNVTVRMNGQLLATFAADAKTKTLLTFPVQADQLGSSDISELVLDVDRTFTPGGPDPRELGIQVFHTFVGPK
jgi:hypothetical protein